MSELVLELLKTSTDIVHISFYNLPRQLVLLSLKYDGYNRTFSAEIVDGVIVVVCRTKTLQPRVSFHQLQTFPP